MKFTLRLDRMGERAAERRATAEHKIEHGNWCCTQSIMLPCFVPCLHVLSHARRHYQMTGIEYSEIEHDDVPPRIRLTDGLRDAPVHSNRLYTVF